MPYGALLRRRFLFLVLAGTILRQLAAEALKIVRNGQYQHHLCFLIPNQSFLAVSGPSFPRTPYHHKAVGEVCESWRNSAPKQYYYIILLFFF